MQDRKIACFTAAVFIGAALTLSATQALAAGPRGDVVVQGKKFDPELQRRVSYADLNLAFAAGQRTLQGRIYRTADQLCWDLNSFPARTCIRDAVASTDGQVAAAIERAKRQMAGLPVGPSLAISMVVGH
jgi:UrcA family protein